MRQDFPLSKVVFTSEFKQGYPIGFNVNSRHTILTFSKNKAKIITRFKGELDTFFYSDEHCWIYDGQYYYVFHIHDRQPGYRGVSCAQYPNPESLSETMPYIKICGFLTGVGLSQADLTALIIRNLHTSTSRIPRHLPEDLTTTTIPVRKLEDDIPKKPKRRRRRRRDYIWVQKHPWYFYY